MMHMYLSIPIYVLIVCIYVCVCVCVCVCIVSPLHIKIQVLTFKTVNVCSINVRMSEIAASPPSTIADDPSALPSPSSSPYSI